MRKRPMADDLLITINDVRKAGFCPSGARHWFEAYGFDFRDFVKNGLPAKTLLATGDAQAQAVVDRKLMAARDGR